MPSIPNTARMVPPKPRDVASEPNCPPSQAAAPCRWPHWPSHRQSSVERRKAIRIYLELFEIAARTSAEAPGAEPAEAPDRA